MKLALSMCFDCLIPSLINTLGGPIWTGLGKNVGWRIDYQIATPAIARKARSVSIYTADVFQIMRH